MALRHQLPDSRQALADRSPPTRIAAAAAVPVEAEGADSLTVISCLIENVSEKARRASGPFLFLKGRRV
jgi:hypothetical protein